jgi:hypothetical protein
MRPVIQPGHSAMKLLAPSRPWADIERFYTDLHKKDDRWSPMLEIARYLGRPPFDSTLFATTSMFSLCVAQTKSIRWMDAMLRIGPGPKWEFITFEYFDHEPQTDPLRPENTFKPWRSTAAPAEAVAKLERILCKRLRWYRIAARQDETGTSR